MKRGNASRCAVAALCLTGALAAVGVAGCAEESAPVDPTDMVSVEEAPAEDAVATPSGDDEVAEEVEAPQQADWVASAQAEVEELVDGYGEGVAVAVLPLDGGEGFAVNGDERFVSASMIKLLILAEFMDEVDAGLIDLDDTYVRDANDVVGGTGVIQGEAAGTVYTFDDLARHMIMYSDNTATNVLIDTMGMEAINNKAAELGLQATDLQRKMMQLDTGVENHISANDAALILRGIANHTLASAELCERAEGYLLKQTDSEGLAEGLPDGIAFGHKTGSLDAIRHDGGIVYSDDPYVVVVLANIGAGEANALMERVSSTVYQTQVD